MQADLCQQLHELRREVMASRTRGRVVIEFDEGAEIDDTALARYAADGMLSLVNFPAMGRHWNAIDRDRASSVLSAILHLNLETLRPQVSTPKSKALAEKVLSYFPAESIYLTNVRPSADLSMSPHRWASGHDYSELDAGVVIVSRQLVGLLWVEDRP